jgi:hypothetical protein
VKPLLLILLCSCMILVPLAVYGEEGFNPWNVTLSSDCPRTLIGAEIEYWGKPSQYGWCDCESKTFDRCTEALKDMAFALNEAHERRTNPVSQPVPMMINDSGIMPRIEPNCGTP